MKKIFLVAFWGATFVYAETSAFGAGNLASDSPYGLNANEKMFKEKLDALRNDYSQLNAAVNQINERLEGLKMILDGINSQYSRSNSRLSQLELDSENRENNLTLELQNLKTYITESRSIQETNNRHFKNVLTELSSLVDSINSNYISKNEFNGLNLMFDSNLSSDNILDNNHTKSEQDNKQDDAWKKKNGGEILDLAIKDVNDNLFEFAKSKLNHLISVGYKPARATFWLGEIEYKQKNYNNAIAYYKKSSAISTKGNYVPKLLYHTAISLDKIGDIESANGFYKALKLNYPNSPEAQASPNRK